MNKCLICNIKLTAANTSDEHIIPNALGGKLRSKRLICRKCNSEFGAGCDARLAESLSLFANFLNIERDRGQAQPLRGTTESQAYKIDPGGKPSVIKPSIDIEEKNDLTQIRIQARDRKQAREILKGLKRQYHDIDVEKTLSQLEYRREYVKSFVALHLSLGGKDSFRSVAKMTLFLLKHRRPDISFDTSRLVGFIKNETDYREIYFFYPSIDVVSKPNKRVFHSIVIKSYTDQKLLVGFVELFNVASFVMVLSDDFADSLQESYVFDVLNRREVEDPSVIIPAIGKGSLDNLFDKKPPMFSQLTAKFEAFLKLAIKRQEDAHRSELIQRAMQNSLMKHPEGARITKEMLDEFVDALMEQLTPLLIKNLKE